MRRATLAGAAISAALLLVTAAYAATSLTPQTDYVVGITTGCVLTDSQHRSVTNETIFSFGALPINGSLGLNESYYLMNLSPKSHTVNAITATDNNTALTLKVVSSQTLPYVLLPGHSLSFTVLGYFTATAWNYTATDVSIAASCN